MSLHPRPHQQPVLASPRPDPRYHPNNSGYAFVAEPATHRAAFTDRTIAQMNAFGETFTGATCRCQWAPRVRVCNWQTSATDVDRDVQCIAIVVRQAGYPSAETL